MSTGLSLTIARNRKGSPGITRKHQGSLWITRERTSERISKGYRSDTAPRGISKRARGRYPGSQGLRYRLPMNWRFHSGAAIKKTRNGVIDTSTPAYRCGGSPGILRNFRTDLREGETFKKSTQPGSRLTRPIEYGRAPQTSAHSTRSGQLWLERRT